MKKIKEKYSLIMAISMVVGIVIGSGIFYKVSEIMQDTGGNIYIALLAFFIVGIGVLFGVYTMSLYCHEEDTNLGIISYAKLAFGDKFSYFVGWFMISIYMPTLVVVLGIYFSDYVFNIFGVDNSILVYTFGFLTIIFLYAINVYKPIAGGKLQELTTLIKIIPLVVIFIYGVFFQNNDTSVIIESSKIEPATISSFFTALIAIAFAFDGWIVATSIHSEIKDAKKNLPRALLSGTLIIIVLYVGFYIGSALIIPASIGINLGDDLIGQIGMIIGGTGGKLFLEICIAISIYGGLNGTILAYIRMPYQLQELELMDYKGFYLESDDEKTIFIKSSLLTMVPVILYYAIQTYCDLSNGVIHGLNIDLSEVPIVTAYILYIALYIGSLKVIKNYKLKKINYLAIFFAIITALIIVIGSLTGNGLLYIVVSISIISIGKFFYIGNKKR